MRRNEDLDAALAELGEAGIRDVAIARGAKHLQLRWSHRGQLRMVSVSGTPSDRRSPHNTRSEVRKLLRTDGLLPERSVPAPTTAPSWRERVETLSRQLSQIPVPIEKVVERAEIVDALHRLMNLDGPPQAIGEGVANGKEVVAG
jgi:hypothetical protein